MKAILAAMILVAVPAMATADQATCRAALPDAVALEASARHLQQTLEASKMSGTPIMQLLPPDNALVSPITTAKNALRDQIAAYIALTEDFAYSVKKCAR